MSALRSMNPETAPGPTGWTVKLMVVGLKNADFARFFRDLVADMATAKALGASMLCSARLTPLVKPDGGIRPIAVGEMFYRLALKALFEANFDPDSLAPSQLGVGSPGGTEPIIRAAQLACDRHPALRRFTHLIALDFRNAFNEGSRSKLAQAIRKYIPRFCKLAEWCYNFASPLFVHGDGGSETIWSEWS